MNDLAQGAAPLVNVGELDRKTYIGGSDIAAILGLDAYGKTALTVYLEKIGELQGITDPQKLKFLARRKRWEGPIVEMLREEFDGEITAVNQRYVDEEHDFMAAEIDFEWRDGETFIQNGEIKTVSPFAFNEGSGWGEAGSDEIPVHYHAQVMHGLGITGRQSCIVCAMSGLDTMTFYRVERDEEAISDMREVAVNFWNNNVLANVPPDPITMGDMMRLFRRRRGRPVLLDDETAKALLNLRIVRDRIKTFTADAAELELTVAKFICSSWGVESEDAAEDNAVLTFNGEEIAKWAAGRGAHLDQKKLAADHPEIKAAYTVPHHFRTFRFKKS